MNEKSTSSFRLSKSTKDKLITLAKDNNTNLSSMLEMCINEYKPNQTTNKEKYYTDLENCVRLIMISPTDTNRNICISFINIWHNNNLITTQEYNNLLTILN